MGILLDERNIPLREALFMLADYEETVKLMNEALENV